MSVTIQEVAEAAGVSKATVSKVLHRSYSISQETCDRVNAVIKELGYQPNRRAQSFATGAQKRFSFWQKCNMVWDLTTRICLKSWPG